MVQIPSKINKSSALDPSLKSLLVNSIEGDIRFDEITTLFNAFKSEKLSFSTGLKLNYNMNLVHSLDIPISSRLRFKN